MASIELGPIILTSGPLLDNDFAKRRYLRLLYKTYNNRAVPDATRMLPVSHEMFRIRTELAAALTIMTPALCAIAAWAARLF